MKRQSSEEKYHSDTGVYHVLHNDRCTLIYAQEEGTRGKYKYLAHETAIGSLLTYAAWLLPAVAIASSGATCCLRDHKAVCIDRPSSGEEFLIGRHSWYGSKSHLNRDLNMQLSCALGDNAHSYTVFTSLSTAGSPVVTPLLIKPHTYTTEAASILHCGDILSLLDLVLYTCPEYIYNCKRPY